MKKLTTYEFIEKAIAVHEDSYDYSEAVYIGRYVKVSILCPMHSKFEQTPAIHFSGRGCPHCGKVRGIPTRKQTNLLRCGVEHAAQNRDIQEKTRQTNLKNHGVEYPQQNKEIHNKRKSTNLKRYGVDNPRKSKQVQEKIKQTNKVRFGCHPKQTKEVQDKFQQTCLDRYGVDNPKQTKEVQDKFQQTCLDRYGVDNPTLSIDILMNRKNSNKTKYGVGSVSQKHMIDVLPLLEDYEWLSDQYEAQQKTATIIATELGVGETTILRYLHGCGIEIKQNNWFSCKGTYWLNAIEEEESIVIQKAPNEFRIPNTRFSADGYCMGTNTIYEFHGDYWHGNPKIYKPNILNKICYKTMGELYQKTIERENRIKDLGYNLVVMWESDWDEQHKYSKPLGTK